MDAGIALKSLDPRSMAEAVLDLGSVTTPEADRRSQRLRSEARRRFCWEVESAVLAEAYSRILAPA